MADPEPTYEIGTCPLCGSQGDLHGSFGCECSGQETWYELTKVVPLYAYEQAASHRERLERVVEAAIAMVEAETAAPLVGVPSSEQPWTKARAKLAAAVEEYRQAIDGGTE